MITVIQRLIRFIKKIVMTFIEKWMKNVNSVMILMKTIGLIVKSLKFKKKCITHRRNVYCLR